MTEPSSSSSGVGQNEASWTWGDLLSSVADNVGKVVRLVQNLQALGELFSGDSSNSEQSGQTVPTRTGPLSPEERETFREYAQERNIKIFRPGGIDREFVDLIMGEKEEDL